MTIPFAPVQIRRPRQPVIRHPAEGFEHAFCQNQVHFIRFVTIPPYVHKVGHVQLPEQPMEVHLMYHALDVRHTDLEGGMDVLPAIAAVDLFGQLCADQALAVELLDCHFAHSLHPPIGAGRTVAAYVLHRNHGHVFHGGLEVLHHDHPAGVEEGTDADPVREHEPVVGVYLAQHAAVESHPQGDALLQALIYVFGYEGQA